MIHNRCHLFLFPLGSVLCQGQGPVHSESCSKPIPPGTTVFRTHTVADGLRSVEAVVTQPEHDPSAVLQNKLGLDKDSLT